MVGIQLAGQRFLDQSNSYSDIDVTEVVFC